MALTSIYQLFLLSSSSSSSYVLPFNKLVNFILPPSLSLSLKFSSNSMKDQDHKSNHLHGLPQVLLLNAQILISKLEPYSHKFHFINVPSSTPLDIFFTAHNHDPSSVRAMICGPIAIMADVLRLLPSLGLLVTASAGTDHIDLRECRGRGVEVANTGVLFSEDVVDLAVGLFIDVMRKIAATDRYVRSRRGSFMSFPSCFQGSQRSRLKFH